MEKVIWAVEDHKNFLIPADEIKKKIYVGDRIYVIDGLPKELNPEVLNEKMNRYAGTNDDFDPRDHYEVIKFLREIGYRHAVTTGFGHYFDVEDAIIYDTEDKEFSNLLYMDDVEIYQWWDGHNWETIEKNDGVTETRVILSADTVELDEWDGHNYTTGGVGEHQYIHSILEKDGELVDGEYLLVYSSEWDGSHDSAEILSLSEVKKQLEKLNRDVGEYLEEVKQLGGGVPRLVGIKEFAEIIGWDKMRLSTKYSRQRKGKKVKKPVPEPIQILAATPVWTLQQAKDYRDEWNEWKIKLDNDYELYEFFKSIGPESPYHAEIVDLISQITVITPDDNVGDAREKIGLNEVFKRIEENHPRKDVYVELLKNSQLPEDALSFFE
ncbi:hypothetical protein ABKP09_19640 [Peribacillus frigoritolerans]|uniref:hypothetical protein n=1 Tax=Peribacillus frigoritolerans TaxID=450367 RepID=UPI0032B4880A